MKKTAPATVKTTAFPSFMAVVSESWQSVSSKLLQLLGLSFGIGLLNLILFVVGLGVSVMAAGLNIDWSILRNTNTDPAVATQFVSEVVSKLPLFLGGFSITLIVTSLLALVTHIVIIKLLAVQKSASLGLLFKQAAQLVLPFLLMQFVVGLLVLGNYVLLFVPGMIVAFLLAFAPFEFVLFGGGIIGSMKRGMKVMATQFGTVLGYLLLFVFAYIILVIFIPNILLKIEPATGLMVLMLRGLVSIPLNWLAMAFSVTLYLHARKRTDVGEGSSIALIVVGAAIGLALLALIGVAAVKAAKRFNLAEKIQAELTKNHQAEVDYELIPSACGLSIPRPMPSQEDDLASGAVMADLSWIYEEVPMSAAAFLPLDTDVHPRTFTLGALMGYRKAAFPAGTTKYDIDFPAVMVKCTENPKHYSLDEYVALTRANKTYDTAIAEKTKLGDVEAVSVNFAEKGKEKNGTEHGFLAVSADGNRLLYITVWGDDEGGSEELQAQRTSILNHLAYRAVDAKLEQPAPAKKPSAAATGSTGGTNAGCKQLTIPQGEFASDKCYSASDYAELSKYIAGYDSAVFSYNSAAGEANVTCQGFTESFKQQCEQAKADVAKAQESMNGYRVAINAVIARGK